MMPSRKFCETGILDYENGERYQQHYHNMGRTPTERCLKRYDSNGIEIFNAMANTKDDTTPIINTKDDTTPNQT
jgi:hypothetical protein